MIKCDLEYCIYNRNFKCVLKRIEINSLGMCDECILISLDRELPEREKGRQLRAIENDS